MVVASIRERQAHNITKTLETPSIWYSRGFLEANQGTPFTEHEADMDSNAEIETAIIFFKANLNNLETINVMMELYESSRVFKSDFTIDIYSLNYMCDQYVKTRRNIFILHFEQFEVWNKNISAGLHIGRT